MSSDYYCIFPMKLVTDEQYKHLSSGSKILYCLFLNRLKFSKMNSVNFSDKNGIFIYYSNAQIQNHICCSSKTATALLCELENAGLIKRLNEQNGKSVKIYVNDILKAGDNTYTYRKSPQNRAYKKSNNYSDYSKKPFTQQSERDNDDVSFDTDMPLSKQQLIRRTFGTKKTGKKSARQ